MDYKIINGFIFFNGKALKIDKITMLENLYKKDNIVLTKQIEKSIVTYGQAQRKIDDEGKEILIPSNPKLKNEKVRISRNVSDGKVYLYLNMSDNARVLLTFNNFRLAILFKLSLLNCLTTGNFSLFKCIEIEDFIKNAKNYMIDKGVDLSLSDIMLIENDDNTKKEVNNFFESLKKEN